MMRGSEFREHVKFQKTIEDALYDVSNGLIYNFRTSDLAFVTGDNKLTDDELHLMDNLLLEKYGERYLNKTGGDLYEVINDELIDPSNVDIQTLSKKIALIFQNKWNYEWRGIWATYNPLHNYSMTETQTHNESGTNVKSGSVGVSGTTSNSYSDTTMPAGIELKSQTNTNNNISSETLYARDYTDSVSSGVDVQAYDKGSEEYLKAGYDTPAGTIGGGMTGNGGYNQEHKVLKNAGADLSHPSSESTTTTSTTTDHKDNTGSKETTTTTGGTSQSNTYEIIDGGSSGQNSGTNANTTTYNDVTDTDSSNGGYTLSRDGNIGVTTNQQMLEQEFTFRDKYNFLMIVLQDVADFISFKIY